MYASQAPSPPLLGKRPLVTEGRSPRLSAILWIDGGLQIVQSFANLVLRTLRNSFGHLPGTDEEMESVRNTAHVLSRGQTGSLNSGLPDTRIQALTPTVSHRENLRSGSGALPPLCDLIGGCPAQGFSSVLQDQF